MNPINPLDVLKPVTHTQGRLIFAYGSLYLEEALQKGDEVCIAHMDRNELRTTPRERDRNAERLALCWNSHDQLVEALRSIAAYPTDHNMTDDGDSGHQEMTKLARAALEKAGAK